MKQQHNSMKEIQKTWQVVETMMKQKADQSVLEKINTSISHITNQQTQMSNTQEKQIEQINLQQAVMEQRVALQSLLGGPLPLRLTSLPTESTP